MIVKIFGVADLTIVGIILLSINSNLMPSKVLLTAGIYLLIKGALFALLSKDIASFLEIFSGIIIITSVFLTIPLLFSYIIAIFLVQKGILSIIG